MDKNKSLNKINFNGEVNFNGPTQIAAGDIINNNNLDSPTAKATYAPEAKWRSPFTLAVLSWISAIIGILGLFPFSKILASTWSFFKGDMQAVLDFSVQKCSVILIILALLFILFFDLRKIAKKQIRIPLILNYAISGYGGRIIVEKIHIGKCPICGGQMKYYNKPVEWREIPCSNGRIKREVIKKIPVLECKRNHEHFYAVDPAEDKVE